MLRMVANDSLQVDLAELRRWMRTMIASRKRGGSRGTEEVETRLGMSGLKECLRGCVTRWESCIQK
jgi:hypothetical protein